MAIDDGEDEFDRDERLAKIGKYIDGNGNTQRYGICACCGDDLKRRKEYWTSDGRILCFYCSK